MPEDSVNSVPTEREGVQPTRAMALGCGKHITTNIWLDGLLIHLLGGGYEIYSLRIEQYNLTVWMYHGTRAIIEPWSYSLVLRVALAEIQ